MALQIPPKVTFYEEATFWNTDWGTPVGANETTNIYDMTKTAVAVGTGELLSKSSYHAMTDPNLLGFGHTQANCAPSCFKQIPAYNFGLGVVRAGSWILQNPLLSGYSATEAYLPSQKIAIAVAATFEPGGVQLARGRAQRERPDLPVDRRLHGPGRPAAHEESDPRRPEGGRVRLSLRRPNGEAPVTAGPGDQTPGAGDRSRLRASHADREQVIDVVKAAFVQGRLAKDEFDQRIGRVFASRTYAGSGRGHRRHPRRADPGPGAQEPAHPAARISMDKKVIRSWASATVMLPGMVVAASAMQSGQPAVFGLIVALVFACLVALPVSGLVMLHSRCEKHSSG